MDWMSAIVGFASGAIVTIIGELTRLKAGARMEQKARLDAAVLDAVAAFCAQAGAAVHSMCWLTWRAKEWSESITLERIEQYDQEIHELFPHLLAAASRVAALELKRYEPVRETLKSIVELDEAIGTASVAFVRHGHADALAALCGDSGKLEKQLPSLLVDLQTKH